MRKSSLRRATLRFSILLLSLASLAAAARAQAPASPKPAIRAITAFVNIDRGRYQIDVSETVAFLKRARTTFEARGYTVETLRLVTQPFPEYTRGLSRADALQFFKNLDGLAQQEDIMVSIGPANLSSPDPAAQADLLADILANTKILQGTILVTKNDAVDWSAVRLAAGVVKKVADSTLHSEGNFRFAALAGVSPYTPFFPAAYHSGSGHQFAIGFESANVVAAAFQDAPDFAAAKRKLTDLLYPQAFDAEDIALRVSADVGWNYLGLDLSPAPSKDASIGSAIESLTKAPFGGSGTLTAAATITGALKDIGARRTGYSGLMLPVLEDPRLADRWDAGFYSIDALLAYSAVCGTGLDTVPLPGDVTQDALAAIIGDVASLSVKWSKPLSARLLPVSGKRAGQRTEFSDPALINGVIQPLPGTLNLAH